MIAELSILLVDDNPVVHFLNKKALQRIGLTRISTVSNGQEALKFLDDKLSQNQPTPDVIFLDLNMPVLDGFGFLDAFGKLISPEKKKTHIAILTSSSHSRDIMHAKELGVNHYLTKPATDDSMRSVLEAILLFE